MTNHEALGLETYYSPHQQQHLKRYLLEDWKAAAVKLPTYSNLLASSISKHFPESWLTKLSRQTMKNMFDDISMPRYEFWACVHYYLLKKYGGKIDINGKEDIEIKQLGLSVSIICASTQNVSTFPSPIDL